MKTQEPNQAPANANPTNETGQATPVTHDSDGPHKKEKTGGAAAGKKPGKRPSGKAKPKKPAASTVHIAFLSLIVLIAIFAVYRLAKWNRGTASDYDPNEVTTEFDVETEDYLMPMDAEMAALQKDDGITTILLLGNAPFADDRGKKGIDGLLEELTDGKVYNGSFRNSYLSVKNAVYEESYPADVFSLYWVTMCLTTQDFTLLEDNARAWDGDEDAAETVALLKNLDMESVDVISIMYDGSDYLDERLLAGPYDDTMAASCCGCLLQSIRLIQQAYPHIRILVSSPTFGCVEEDGKLTPGSQVNFGQGTLPDYMIAYKNIAVNAGVSFLDHYFGTITEDNYTKYLKEDGFHLNDAGRRLVAERIAKFTGAAGAAQ